MKFLSINNWALLVIAVMVGCDGSPSAGELEEFSRVSKPLLPGPPAESSQEFDFGTVFARGQTLHHQFEISNKNGKKLKVIGATALTPCCSAIGPLPKFVSPNETVKIPVELKAGSQTGKRAVQFVVETDSSSSSTQTLTLRANIVSEVEVISSDADDPVLVDGESIGRTFQIKSRRLGDQGRGAPTDVKASPPLVAEFIGAADESGSSGGLVEATRTLKVTYSKAGNPGPQSGEMIFLWPDNPSHRYPLKWHVRPDLAATPASLLVTAGEGRSRRSIRIRSSREDFRVTAISGDLLAGPFRSLSPGASRDQSVEFEIDPSRIAGQSTSMIRVTTDHPGQQNIDLIAILIPK